MSGEGVCSGRNARLTATQTAHGLLGKYTGISRLGLRKI